MDNIEKKLLPLAKKFLPGDSVTLSRVDFDSASPMGQGSFGKVFKVKHKKTKKWYAIKVVSKPQIINLKMVDQLKAEIQIMISLSHPCVIELYTYFEDGTNIFLVMELADGHLYAKLKKQTKFDEYQAARYFRDAASAIAHQHSRNPCIIHRDIKPENQLLCGDSLKIADFGWSSLSQGVRKTYCGTPDYLAPEMIKESGHTEKLDVWTLGILQYELLCGKAPFTPQGGKDRREKMRRLEVNILNMNIDFAPGFSAKGKRLILKCLQKNPEMRISAENMLHDEFITSHGLKPIREMVDNSNNTAVGESRRYVEKLESRLANARNASREKADELNNLNQIHRQRSKSRDAPGDPVTIYKLNTEGSDKWGSNRHMPQTGPISNNNLYGATANDLPPRRVQRQNNNNADAKSPQIVRTASQGLKNNYLDQDSNRGNSKDINSGVYNKNFANTEQNWGTRVDNVMAKIDSIRARTPSRIAANSPLIQKYTSSFTEQSPSSNNVHEFRYDNKNRTASNTNQSYQAKNYINQSPSHTSYLKSNTQNTPNNNPEKKVTYPIDINTITNTVRSNSRTRANSGYLTGYEKLKTMNIVSKDDSREHEPNYLQTPKSNQIASTIDQTPNQNTLSNYLNKDKSNYYQHENSNIHNKSREAVIQSEKFLKTTDLNNQKQYDYKNQAYGLLSERNVKNQDDEKSNKNLQTRHTADELGIDKNFTKTQGSFESQQIKANPKLVTETMPITSYSNNILKKQNSHELNTLNDVDYLMIKAQSENSNDIENLPKKSANYSSSFDYKKSSNNNSIDITENSKNITDTPTNNMFFKVKNVNIDEPESITDQFKRSQVNNSIQKKEILSATKNDLKNDSFIRKIDEHIINPSFMQNSSTFMDEVNNIPGIYTANKANAKWNYDKNSIDVNHNLENEKPVPQNNKSASNISIDMALQEIAKLQKEVYAESEVKKTYENKLIKEKEKNLDSSEKIKALELENKTLHKKYMECNQYMILDEENNRFITNDDYKLMLAKLQEQTSNQTNNTDIEYLKSQLDATKNLLKMKEDSIKKLSQDFAVLDANCVDSLQLLREFHPNFGTKENCGIPFFQEIVVGLQTKLKDLHNSNLSYMVDINELKSELASIKDVARISTIKNANSTSKNSQIQKQRAWQDQGWSSIFQDNDPNTGKFIKQLQNQNKDFKDIVDYLFQNQEKFEDKFNKYYTNFTMEETLNNLTKGLLFEVKEMLDNVNLIKDSDKFKVVNNFIKI